MNSEQALGYSRKLAISFGILLAVIEVFYNWGNPSWWPFILVDYIAVMLLVFGALRSNLLLAAAWGFTCAMFYMSFFMSFELEQATLVIMAKGVLLAITFIGLLLTVGGISRDSLQQR